MRYIIADKTKASDAGINLLGHRTNGNLVILNEKEVMMSPSLNGDLEKRCVAILGTCYTRDGIEDALREGGWNG